MISTAFRAKIEREVVAFVRAKRDGGSATLGEGYTIRNRAGLVQDAAVVVAASRALPREAGRLRAEAKELRALRRELDATADRLRRATRGR